MSKRIIALLTIFVLSLSFLPCFASAAETAQTEQIIQLENGYYLVVTIYEESARSANTKTATKSYDCRAIDGTVEWKAVLKGTFTYDGTTSTCTSSSCSVTVFADNWYEISKTAGKSGNTATATITMGRTFLGITIAKEDYPMTLTCDKNGNLS